MSYWHKILPCLLRLFWLFGIGFLPGFPTPVFLILSAMLGVYFFKIKWKNSKKEYKKEDEKDNLNATNVDSKKDLCQIYFLVNMGKK